MGFPNQFPFVRDGATYDAFLVEANGGSPAAPTGVCCLCQQPVGGRDYYVIASPYLFHVHADCAMAAPGAGHNDGGGQQHYYPPPPPPPPSSYGWPRPPMPNCSSSGRAQYGSQPCYPPPPPPPPYYSHPPPPHMNYSHPPLTAAYYYQPPTPTPPAHRRHSLSSVTGIIKTAAAVACKAFLLDEL